MANFQFSPQVLRTKMARVLIYDSPSSPCYMPALRTEPYTGANILPPTKYVTTCTDLRSTLCSLGKPTAYRRFYRDAWARRHRPILKVLWSALIIVLLCLLHTKCTILVFFFILCIFLITDQPCIDMKNNLRPLTYLALQSTPQPPLITLGHVAPRKAVGPL